MNADDVMLSRESGVLTLTLNRPDRMNAITPAMLEELERIFATQVDRPEVSAVVLTGAGRAFCAGADLKTGDQRTAAESTRLMDVTNHIIRMITDCPVPVIAAVNGPAAGFGVSLAAAADLAIAGTSAYFLLAFARVGLMPDGGATALIAASIGRARAMRMMLLGEKVSATDAADLGLIAEVVEDDALPQRTAELTEQITHCSRPAMRLTRQSVNAASLTALADALHRERDGQSNLLSSDEFISAMQEFTSRSRPTSPAD